MIKRLFPLLLLVATAAYGADLAAPYTFTDGGTVNAALLNNHVNNATILPAFITGKASATPVGGDAIVYYQASSGALKQCTLNSLLTLLTTSATLSGNTTISQQFLLTGDNTPATITADQNDYAPASLSTATTLRLSSDATRNITGLSGGADGRILVIHNVGSFNIVLNKQNTGSLAANRFALPHDLTIAPNNVAILHYDSDPTVLRWRTSAAHTHAIADVTDAPNSLAPAFTALTDGATVTMTANPTSAVQNRTWTLGATGTYPHILQFSGVTSGMTGTIKVIQDATGSRTIVLPGPQFTDAVLNSTTTVTSATATFVNSAAPTGDVGAPIVAVGIPTGATIASVTNATTVVLSAAATATASGVTITLPRRYSMVSGNGNGRVTLTTGANSTDWLTWVCDGTNSYSWSIGTNFR